MKKLAAIFMCIIMTAGFSACSKDSGNFSETLSAASNETVTEKVTTVSKTETKTETTTSEATVSETETETETKSETTTAEVTTAAEVAVTTTAAATTTAATTATEPPAKGGKILIAYFTWSGNTVTMANTIADKTGGELFEIVPVTPYPTVYQECGETALEERDSNARPKIKNLPASIEEYDTIFIGYPIWGHTAPIIIGTFLENYDLTGVEVYPFTQSASMDVEQFENSMEFVRGCAGNGNVHEGLFVEADDTDGIIKYLTSNGFAE